MDSNETNCKLLNRDSFSQVNGINNQKKENTGYRIPFDAGNRAGNQQKWAKSHGLLDWNGRKRNYTQKTVPGITQQFRIVRDNRKNQSIREDVMGGTLQNSPNENLQGASNVQKKRFSSILVFGGLPCLNGNLIDHKHFARGNSDEWVVRQNLNGRCDSDPGHGKDERSSRIGRSSLPEETQMNVSILTGMFGRDVKNKSQSHPEIIASAKPIVGVYASSLDPVHVPSSRSVGAAGAIQRDVGIVGVRPKTSEPDRSVTCTSYETSALRHNATSFRSSHLNPSASKTIFPTMPIMKSFAAHPYDGKLHQQVNGHLRAKHPNMAWKPKSSQRSNLDSASGAMQTSQVQAAALSDKFLQVDTSKSEHVIIPEHLRVPESKRAGLMFGSFGAESPLKAPKDAENSISALSPSTSTTVSIGLVQNPVAGRTVHIDCQVRTSSSNDSASADEPKLSLPVNDECLSPRDIETYPDIGLIQSHAACCVLHEPQSQKSHSSLADCSAYGSQVMFEMPFSKIFMEDNAQGEGLLSVNEDLGTHAANNSSLSDMCMVQQQQHLTQLYPQVHISHYPNLVPYRQILTPLYVPQHLVTNYLNNSAHVHPFTGSNYLMAGGQSPQVTSRNMKYNASQIKPGQAGSPTTGYASYTNSGGYMVGAVSSTAGMEDLAGTNIEQNNVYGPNLQLDGNIWIQTPRTLASVQSTQCYDLPGQAQPLPTYLSAGHAANPALDPVAFPSPHLQYPAFFHPSQSGFVTGQQVESGLAANSIMGITPAAAAQVGAYQQTHLGHLGWPSNF